MAGHAAQNRIGAGALKKQFRTGSWPVRIYLFALIIVILIPVMAVAFVLLIRTYDAQENVVQALTNATVQAIGQSVDREIAGMVTTLRVLATSRELDEGDFASLHQRGVLALTGSGAYLIAVDDELVQLINTRRDYGEALGATADAATAQRAIERNLPTISGVFMGRVAQTNVFNVWLPLSNNPRVRLLALTQNASGLLRALQSRQLPDGWHAAVVDGRNAVVVATPDANLPSGSILAISGQHSSGRSWGREVVRGQPVVTSEWQSGLTGWRVIAWASDSQVRQPLGESVVQLGAWGLAIALAAALIAVLIARRIGDSVQGLRLDARRLGRGEMVYPRSYPVVEIAEVSKALSEASEQRAMAERDVRFLMRELAHRSKNQMAVIAAMAKQTSRGATDINHYVEALERRIMGLARSTDLLLANGRAGVTLSELIELQLQPFLPPGPDRFLVLGPDLRINPQGAQILGMALHEMATNATRYGAFADPDGKLSLTWTVSETELLMNWRETLSMPLTDSNRTGFGTIVLRSMVGGALGAQVERVDHEDGVEWVFRVPLPALDPAFAAARPDEDLEYQ